MRLSLSAPTRLIVAGGIALGLLASSSASAAEDVAPSIDSSPTKTLTDALDPTLQPKVQDLGNQRYKVGLIEIDRAKGRFTVPGAVLRNEPPIEFVAISTGGHKAYEALLELGSTAYEFNLACILIGLDGEGTKPPRYHFDPQPAAGAPVDLFVEWSVAGSTVKAHASDLIASEGQTLARSSWVYTGSAFGPDGQYLAHLDGTLVGFVHDPASIIEHRTGFLNNFEGVTANTDVLPAVGQRVSLIVELRSPKESD